MVAAGNRGPSRNPVDPSQIPDEFYGLKDENLVLKRRVNDQDEKTKQLITKVQRLTEDLRRAKEPTGIDASRPAAAATRASINRREAAEVDSMVADLRDQLRNLAKDNSQLKNKMNFFKSLHEAESRKGMRYDHIPPRINSGVKKLHPALTVRGRTRDRGADSSVISGGDDHVCPTEDVAKLEEIVTMLRGKLVDAERDAENARAENKRLLDARESQDQQHDIDKLTYQRTVADLQKRLHEAQSKTDALDEKNRGLTESYNDALHTVETLTEDLKEERRRRAEIEARIGLSDGTAKRIEELKIIITDLRVEKKLLEDEQARLLAAQFSTQQEDEWDAERKKSQLSITDLEKRLADSLREAVDLHALVNELRGQLTAALNEKRQAEIETYNVRHELDELKRAIAFLVKDSVDGKVDWDMVRDAVDLWRKRNGGNIPGRADDLEAEKRLLQDLRIQYARCIEDLERTKKLLALQEEINKDYKSEIKQLMARLEALKNEYEMRIEENCRLLDLRANRIAVLEAQLKNFAYGPGIIVPDLDDDDNVKLEMGQNLITISMNAALITPEGYDLLDRLHARALPTTAAGNVTTTMMAKRSRETFTTFLYFDFFDHETAVSPVMKGVCPGYAFRAKYKLFIDDFCLMYLQSQPVVVYLCRSDGLDFVEIAKCTIRFRDLTTATRTDAMQYYGDLVSTHDHKTIVGRLDYTLGVRLPMAQSIRAFKERTVALNLMSVGDGGIDSGNRFGSRGAVNELIVSVDKCTNLDVATRREALGDNCGDPAVYLAFKVLNHDHVVTNTVKGTPDPVFDYLRTFRMNMNADTDRRLRTSVLSIIVLDDSDHDYMYGTVKIPLNDLALGQPIEGQFGVVDADGKMAGHLHMRITWEKPYKLDVTPMVSHLEDAPTAAEFRVEERIKPHSPEEKEKVVKVPGSPTMHPPLPKPLSKGELLPKRRRGKHFAPSLSSSVGDLGAASPGEALSRRESSARLSPETADQATGSSAWSEGGDDSASELAVDFSMEDIQPKQEEQGKDSDQESAPSSLSPSHHSQSPPVRESHAVDDGR
ncbi:hypothetical protein PhCBS80983_g04843 [Powellomyces hirtus]|uniref:C2 domain-containing protein n=1 Tax=Powellomyces hirtus TaxID=109895 RepID=A0A507DYX2_9FUNG|nr:hypothetical protein PhCBS80983_g04843 [Powellomyces hirtus]